jgi:hypothetical protein
MSDSVVLADTGFAGVINTKVCLQLDDDHHSISCSHLMNGYLLPDELLFVDGQL